MLGSCFATVWRFQRTQSGEVRRRTHKECAVEHLDVMRGGWTPWHGLDAVAGLGSYNCDAPTQPLLMMPKRGLLGRHHHVFWQDRGEQASTGLPMDPQPIVASVIVWGG
jgi:hypothetical protein